MKRRLRLASVCSLAAIAILLFWTLASADHSLFNLAVMVQSREDYIFPAIPGRSQPPLRLTGDWPYCWVTPRILLTLPFSKNSIMALEPRLVDTSTGLRLPATRLAKFAGVTLNSISFIGYPSAGVQTQFFCRASQDGAWILAPRCAYWESARLQRSAVAVSVNDSREVVWPIQRYGYGGDPMPQSAVWLPDGRRWVGLIRWQDGYRIRVCDVDRPTGTREYAYDHRIGTDWTRRLGVDPTLAGTLADGRVMVMDWRGVADGQVSTARFTPDTEAEHPIQQAIRVPGGSSAVPAVAPVLSPSGDRLAWFVRIRRSPPGWPAMSRFWSFLRMTPTTRVGLWTTRPDGSDPHEIGFYTPAGLGDRPAQLQWTPDGRRLSFRYQGALYAVHAR